MVCLDTDIIIDFLRNDKTIISKVNFLKNKDISLFTTSINSFELFKGVVNQENREKEKLGVLTFLSGVSLLNFNFSSSKKAAEIFNLLVSKGEIIELPDIMIAAICIENQEPLLTRNTKHFSKIPELKLEKI